MEKSIDSITEVEFSNNFVLVAGELYRCIGPILTVHSGDIVIRSGNKLSFVYAAFRSGIQSIIKPITIISLKTSNFTTLYAKLDQ